MNIKFLKKLQKARRYFLDICLEKSGNNNFKNFKYWELKDIIPHKQYICEELGMETSWDFGKGEAGLLLWDLDQSDDQEPIRFTQQVSEIEAKTMMDNQDIGGSQTYVERYLLQQMFDIVDNDVIDSKDPDERFKKEKKTVKKTVQKKPVQKKETVKQVDNDRIRTLANEVGDRLYNDGRKSITKVNVAKECDKMIEENLMNKVEKREVVNLVP